MGLVSASLITLVLVWIIHFVIKKLRTILKQINAVQGPPTWPLIGNLHQFHFKPDEFFEQAQGIAYMLQARGERMCRIWFGPCPWILLYGADECEAILGSNKILDKPFQYGFLSGWIGQGLLISEPKKWRSRRKLLTPTFHYDILKDFVGVYNKHGQTLLQKFHALCGNQYNDIFHMISLCTLDIICEAALGTHVDAQNKSSPYLDAVCKIKYIIHQRTLKAHFYFDTIYNIFGSGKDESKCTEILHEFTGAAIANRKRLVDEAGGVSSLMEKETVSGKRRMAFLDFMLDLNAKGELPMEGVQEEVDTFTFEAHDSTSTSMNWFLHLMGTNPEIQAKVQKEVDEVLGEGQRFALMEEKCILALLMRNLKVKSKLRTDQMRVSAELVIRPLFGNNIRFEARKFGDYVQIA
uniref:Bm2409, isoform b n=2 Tax=Brugia malayi TaxID=6279 RepID=A0A1I9G1D1_BRUMA|nr:Bm2409, isoform b [Brugia malayi]